jgi:hypothetical protein
MTARAGWPDHRMRCRAADHSAVEETRRLVGGTDWRVRICRDCGAVSLEPTVLAPDGGDAA